MEIYEQEQSTLEYTVWVDGEPTEVDDMTLHIYSDAGVVKDYTATYDDGKYRVTLQGSDVAAQPPRTFTWSYSLGGGVFQTAREHLIVARPIIPFNEFISRFPDSPLTSETYWRYESVARRVVEVFCNQDFNREDNASHTIMGQGIDVLHLPRRIINLRSISMIDSFEGDTSDISQYVTVDDDYRWAIRRRGSRGLSPVSRTGLFRHPSYYTVVGDWGWEAVPQDVAVAGAIIIDEFTDVDAKYREKYVKTLSAANWRQQSVVTGDETTGNANADMILSGYKNTAFAVV